MGNTSNPREQSGMEIATKPNHIKRIDENLYHVKSQSPKNDSWYEIVSTEGGFVCNCPDSQWREVKCKHVYAVEFSIQFRKQVQTTVISQVETNCCKFCQSLQIIRKGVRKNKNYNLQVYKCQSCNKRFSINLGFEGMKASPQMITTAMQLYFSGESLRNVQKFLELQGVRITHKTVWNWIRKYVGLMESYLEKITPNLSNTWRADELIFKVKGNPKYLYAMMDDETRFWIAKQVSNKKFTADVRPMFKEGVEVAKKKPAVLITDGAHNFMDAHKKEYWTLKSPKSIHVRHIHIKGDMNNNKMERLNGEIRDREKVMRGIKKDDSPIITGYQIYHNYIRSHMALDGETPADKAGIKIEGNNKWITLIQNASVRRD